MCLISELKAAIVTLHPLCFETDPILYVRWFFPLHGEETQK